MEALKELLMFLMAVVVFYLAAAIGIAIWLGVYLPPL